MRALALAMSIASSGCFTSWAITQGFGTQKILDESVNEQTVPLAGVDEKLAVSLPLDIQYQYGPAAANTSTTTTQVRERTELPFALTCSTKQYARDRTYHSAFRYGSRWKKMSGGMFLAEAAVGALLLWLDHNREPPEPMQPDGRTGLIVGGFLAIDAVGTLAIFFIPRKEVFTVDDKAVMTPIREDCPDGLVLDIGGTSYPIDAAGRIGEVGEVALDEWMRTSDGAGTSAPGAGTSAPGAGTSAPGAGTSAPGAGTLALTFEGRAMPLRVDTRERCAWVRARVPTGANANPGSSTNPGSTTNPGSSTNLDANASTGTGTSASPGASTNPGAGANANNDEAVQRACNTPGQYVTVADLPRFTTAVITVPTGSLSMAAAPATTDSR